MAAGRPALTPRDGPPQAQRLVLPPLPPKHVPKPPPVHRRHTATSANWSRRDESPRLHNQLTPRERALARASMRKPVRSRDMETTPAFSPPSFSPFLDSEQAQRPEILQLGDELAMYHDLLKGKLTTRFKSLGRAFRLMDRDKSNTCDTQEVREGLTRMFNLEHIPRSTMDRMVELMDTSGDGVVRLDEFARFFTDDHRPQSAVNVRRENALRRARPASSPPRGRF